MFLCFDSKVVCQTANASEWFVYMPDCHMIQPVLILSIFNVLVMFFALDSPKESDLREAVLGFYSPSYPLGFSFQSCYHSMFKFKGAKKRRKRKWKSQAYISFPLFFNHRCFLAFLALSCSLFLFCISSAMTVVLRKSPWIRSPS